MQPHYLHQKLITVGGTIERAGTGAVVGLGFRLQQLVFTDLALGVELANALLLFIGQPRRHGTSRYQNSRQVAEAQRPDQQTRNDFVADAEQHGGIEHIMTQGDRRTHGDGVA